MRVCGAVLNALHFIESVEEVDMAHCAEARRVRRELDEQLAAASAATGRDLVWTAQDRVVLSLITSAIDRKLNLIGDQEGAHG